MPVKHRHANRAAVGIVLLAAVAYGFLTLAAPKDSTSTQYHIPLAAAILLSVTIIGLVVMAWVFGTLAWLDLDKYAWRLPAPGRRAFGKIAAGMKYLAFGLMISTLISSAQAFYASQTHLVTITTEINYCILLASSFAGFLCLRTGTRHLAVSAHADMSVGAKLATIGPPAVLLGGFYTYLALTNTTASAQSLFAGPVGKVLLALTIVIVVCSWALGLLAALNIERATHGVENAAQAGPFIRLYSGILLTTCGFIILNALISLGGTRLMALPVSVIIVLLYLFIGVVALGFMEVARSARQLNALLPAESRRVA